MELHLHFSLWKACHIDANRGNKWYFISVSLLCNISSLPFFCAMKCCDNACQVLLKLWALKMKYKIAWSLGKEAFKKLSNWALRQDYSGFITLNRFSSIFNEMVLKLHCLGTLHDWCLRLNFNFNSLMFLTSFSPLWWSPIVNDHRAINFP